MSSLGWGRLAAPKSCESPVLPPANRGRASPWRTVARVPSDRAGHDRYGRRAHPWAGSRASDDGCAGRALPDGSPCRRWRELALAGPRLYRGGRHGGAPTRGLTCWSNLVVNWSTSERYFHRSTHFHSSTVENISTHHPPLLPDSGWSQKSRNSGVIFSSWPTSGP